MRASWKSSETILVARLSRHDHCLDALLGKEVAKERLSAVDKEAAMSRITWTDQIGDLADADFVIEAVSEDLALKQNLLARLNAILPVSKADDIIVASNTSSISITKLAASYRRPDRFVGMHFMNPVPVMRLIELIAGRQTSLLTMEITRGLAEAMGKTTTTSQDIPGFIANRILMPYINEAVWVLYEGIGTREDIDKTMLLGTNVPMGPLKLADFIGLDTCLAITRVLHSELGDSKYRPCPLLVQYVNAGWLGKKAGRGFYEYSKV